MLPIKQLQGKYTNAIVFTDLVEQEALEQIQLLCDQPIAAGSQVRIMPDVHAGAGCTIGTTMTIGDKIIPALVGVDIGCGMLTVGIGKQKLPLEELDKLIYRCIPSGQSVRQSSHPLMEQIDLNQLRCSKYVNLERAAFSLGTLGGGNHFIEVDSDEEGNQYLVVHSGSRNLGVQVANYYKKVGFEQMQMEGVKTSQNLVAEMKAQGGYQEIESALQSFVVEKKTLDITMSLAYVSGQLFEDYIHDMTIVQRFSQLNRQAMMDTMLSELGLTETQRFETIHNYIDMESMILRKGAVSAKLGEKLLIPINMRDGSLICTGKGNPEWNCSAPHGAGRLMSRSKAKETLNMAEFTQSMEGIYTTSVHESTIDEAPMAYKPMEAIISNIHPTVEINSIIRPIYNFKAKS